MVSYPMAKARGFRPEAFGEKDLRFCPNCGDPVTETDFI